MRCSTVGIMSNKQSQIRSNFARNHRLGLLNYGRSFGPMFFSSALARAIISEDQIIVDSPSVNRCQTIN